jgi:hypothetical protein
MAGEAQCATSGALERDDDMDPYSCWQMVMQTGTYAYENETIFVMRRKETMICKTRNDINPR